MSEAIDLVFVRLQKEESFKQYPYNDRTAARVTCKTNDPETTGNLSWLYGLNLETEGSPELGELVARWKLGKLYTSLTGYSWFSTAGAPRQSVFLDIAYNAGLHGLLNFPSMIHFASLGDWNQAAAECSVKDPRLFGRYAALREILKTGVA